MRSGRDKACQVTRTLQHPPSFLWGTTQKHGSELHLGSALDVWPCCTSPSLRSRVSVPAMRDSCMWAASPEQNRGRGGSRHQPCKSGLPPSVLPCGLQHPELARRLLRVPSPTCRCWGGGLGSCRYVLLHVTHPTEDQWTLDGQT